jgi:hypothetical protein
LEYIPSYLCAKSKFSSFLKSFNVAKILKMPCHFAESKELNFFFSSTCISCWRGAARNFREALQTRQVIYFSMDNWETILFTSLLRWQKAVTPSTKFGPDFYKDCFCREPYHCLFPALKKCKLYSTGIIGLTDF